MLAVSPNKKRSDKGLKYKATEQSRDYSDKKVSSIKCIKEK